MRSVIAQNLVVFEQLIVKCKLKFNLTLSSYFRYKKKQKTFYSGDNNVLRASLLCGWEERRGKMVGGRRNKMRGKVAVAVIVVLACALFLVPYASAKVGITCSVYPEEANFQSEFVYSITLTNPGYVTTGELCLKVGSDSDNRDTTREWDVTEMELEPGSSGEIENGKIRIEKGESCTVIKKGVKFTHPELKQGAFRDWTKTKIPKWERAWYKCCFKPSPYGDEACCDDFEKPILTHCIEEFREHHVEQNEVYKDLSFDYSIKVWANSEDRIELQVRNYSNTSPSGWDKQVLQNYTEHDVETNNTKTLTWPAVNLTIDNFDSGGRGHYRFVGTINKSKTYSGPRIEERFKDPKVSYKKTINEWLLFDYEVSVWIDQVKDSIVLKVYNYSLRGWEEKGIRNYTTPGNYQPLKWESINLSRDYFDGNPLIGKYQFVGKYNTSKNNGYRIEEKFYKLRVTPTEGENNITFNYSVTVNANIYDKIELQVKNHTTTGLWDSKGTRDYTTLNINETLTWHNLQLNTHELNRRNDSKFRFVGKCGAKSSEEGLGLPIWPIRPFFRNNSVKPDRGLYNEKFNYNVDVKAEKNGTVNLSIFCPDGILLYEIKQDYNEAPLWQTLNWTVPNFNGCDLKTGNARYRFGFRYKGNEIINLTGEEPYIGIAKFGNETVKPKLHNWDTLFNYSVDMIAADVGKVELLTKCPRGTIWDTQGEKEYGTIGSWKTLKWAGIELPCENCGDAEYMFRFMPGFVESKNYSGPTLRIEEFGVLSVSPGKGTDYTEFNFSVNFSGCIEEDLILQVWNSSSKKWKNVSSGHYVPLHIETISFPKIQCPENLVPQWSNEKDIKWRVKGIISNSSIASTYWDIELRWYNSSFYPEEGWWNDKFNFSVNLSANLEGFVELQIKLDDSTNNSWNPVGEKMRYNRADPQIVSWESESICSESYKGSVSYKFVFYWRDLHFLPHSTIVHGPEVFIPLNIRFEENSVEPGDGAYYNFNDYIFSEAKNTQFNFSINVTADDNTTIELVLLEPDGKKHTMNECKCNYRKPHQPKKCSWTMIELPSGQIRTWNYTFRYYDERLFYDTGYGWNRVNKTFEGPELVAVFEEYHSSPNLGPDGLTWGELVNVTVCMNGTEEMDITLEAHNVDPYSPDYNNWTEIGTEPEHYYATGKECLNWTIDTYIVPFDKLRLKW